MRMRRKWPWLVGIGLLLLIPLLIWVSLAQRLEMAVNQALWAEGLTGAQLEVTGISWGEAEGRLLLDTGCAPDCAGYAGLSFTLGGLWRREIDHLFIRDLSWSPSYSALAPRQALAAGWRWRRLAFQSIRLPLSGEAALLLDNGDLQPDPQGWRVNADGRLLWAGQELAPVRLEGGWDGQRLGLDLLPTAGPPSLTGNLSLRQDGSAGWEGLMAVQAEGVALAGLSNMSALLRGEMKAGRIAGLDLRLVLPEQAGALLRTGHVRLQLTPAPAGDPARLAGLLEAGDVGLVDGPSDNRLALPFQLWRDAVGWQVGPAETGTGSIGIPAWGMAVDGLRLEGRDGEGRLTLTATVLRTGTNPALLVPLRPSLSLRLDEGGGLDWELRATAPLLTLTGAGRVDLAGSQHRLDLALAHRSPPEGPPVATASLSPWLAQWVTAVGGSATLALTADSVTYRGRLDLQDLAVQWPGGRLSGITGRLDVPAWSPLIIKGDGLRVGALTTDALTLTGGVGDLSLSGDGIVRLGPMSMRWQAIPVTVGPLALGLGTPLPLLPVEMAPAPLQTLLDTLGAGGLAGEGEVAGTVLMPLRAGQAGQGAFSATGPGSLALRPAADLGFLDPGRNNNLALVTEALRQFRFRRLVVEPVPQALVLRLSGVNPGFYGGYDMDLSLVLAPSP